MDEIHIRSYSWSRLITDIFEQIPINHPVIEEHPAQYASGIPKVAAFEGVRDTEPPSSM